jgi:hypothetical protein
VKQRPVHSPFPFKLLAHSIPRAAMEQFFTPFRPTGGVQGIWEDYNIGSPFEYTEVELVVPMETFLSYPWDWADLCALSPAMPSVKFCGSQTTRFLRSTLTIPFTLLLMVLIGVFRCLLRPRQRTTKSKTWYFMNAVAPPFQPKYTLFSGVP